MSFLQGSAPRGSRVAGRGITPARLFLNLAERPLPSLGGETWQESEYEDDYEAEDDAYSDAFEAEDADEPEAAEASTAQQPADSEPPSPANAGGHPPPAAHISEPSDSASQYSEPEEEEPNLLEPEEPEDYSEDLEVEVQNSEESQDGHGANYYTPSDVSNSKSEGGDDVRQSCSSSVWPVARTPG